MNILSALLADASPVATRITFDGQLTENAQIQLDNIQISNQACPSSRSFVLL